MSSHQRPALNIKTIQKDILIKSMVGQPRRRSCKRKLPSNPNRCGFGVSAFGGRVRVSGGRAGRAQTVGAGSQPLRGEALSGAPPGRWPPALASDPREVNPRL